MPRRVGRSGSGRARRAPPEGGRPPDRHAPGGDREQADSGDPHRIDRLAFALFAGALLLVFSTAILSHFTLPKLLVVAVYAAWSAGRWMVHASHGRVVRLPPALEWTVVALVAWWALTTIVAQHPPTALFGLHGRENGLLTLCAGLALFVMAATVDVADAEIEHRLAWPAAALAIGALYALLQAVGIDWLAWPEGRPAATMGHPVILGGTLVTVLPFAIFFTLAAPGRRARAAWLMTSVVMVLALVVTLARGPWLAGVASLLVFMALVWARRPRLGRRLAFALLVLVLLGGSAVALHEPVRQRVLVRMTSFGQLLQDSSVSNRVLFYRAAFAMARDHPAWGIGLENFALVYPGYRSASSERLAPDVIPTMVHSGPLQAAVSGGLPALLLSLLFPVLVACGLARRWAREPDPRQQLFGAACLASLTAYLVQDVSGWPDVALDTLACVVWGYGVAWSLQPSSSRRRITPRGALAVGTLILTSNLWLGYDTWQRIRAERLVMGVGRMNMQAAWPTVEARLRRALQISPETAWASDAAAIVYEQRLVETGDRTAYAHACWLAMQAQSVNPFDPYLRIRRVELDIAALGRGVIAEATDDARRSLAAAREMDPNNGTVHEGAARLALATGDPGAALTAIGRAIELRPRQGRYRVVQGDALRALGRRAETERAYRAAVALAEGRIDELTQARRRLVYLLAEEGRHVDAVAEARTLVADAPADTLAWVLLGISLEASGATTEARAAFARAAALDPSSKPARDGLERLARKR